MDDLERRTKEATSGNQDVRAALTPEQQHFFDKVVGIGGFAEIKDPAGAWPDRSYIKQELIARWGPEGAHIKHAEDIFDPKLARYEIPQQGYSQK